MLASFSDWISDKFIYMYNSLLTQLLTYVPEDWKVEVDENVRPIIDFVELWFPLNFAVTLLLAWVSFIIGYAIFRFMFRLIFG